MEIIAATNNAHKLEEIRRILQPMGHTVLSLKEVGLDIDPEETGTTFAANALIKARAVCAAAGRPAIADDSGLAVDALNGAPGVYSARYAGQHGNDAANNQKLLREMAGVPAASRGGRFVSAIALALPDSRVLQAEGFCEGVIGYELQGSNGFGYDPLFYVNGKSFAQMQDTEKDAISHRGAALKLFAQRLPVFLAGSEQPAV